MRVSCERCAAAGAGKDVVAAAVREPGGGPGGRGGQRLQPVLAGCARAAASRDGYLKARCRRHVTKRGGCRPGAARGKAIIVVASALLVITWHVLAAGRPCDEPCARYYTRRPGPGRETRPLAVLIRCHDVTLKGL